MYLDLAAIGFDAEWGVYRADEVGAPHRRERLFILGYCAANDHALAYADGKGLGVDGTPHDDHRSDAPGNDDHRRGSSMGDAVRERHAQRRGQRRGLRSQLATADGAGGALVDADDELRDGWERDPRRRAAERTAAGGTGASLADASASGRDPQRLEPDAAARRRTDAGRSGGAPHVSDTIGDAVRIESERHQREGRRVRAAERGNAEPRDDGAPWGSPFPPGPDDADGWRRFLVSYPGAEPAIRRDADGLAYRLDRLRLCGNGVVELQAAYAFADLWSRLFG